MVIENRGRAYKGFVDFWTMFTWGPSLVMGWPAIVASIMCALVALALKKYRLMIAAAIVASPFCLLYLLPVGAVVFAGYIAAVHELKKGHRWRAAVFVAQFFAISVLLATTMRTP